MYEKLVIKHFKDRTQNILSFHQIMHFNFSKQINRTKADQSSASSAACATTLL